MGTHPQSLTVHCSWDQCEALGRPGCTTLDEFVDSSFHDTAEYHQRFFFAMVHGVWHTPGTINQSMPPECQGNSISMTVTWPARRPYNDTICMHHQVCRRDNLVTNMRKCTIPTCKRDANAMQLDWGFVRNVSSCKPLMRDAKLCNGQSNGTNQVLWRTTKGSHAVQLYQTLSHSRWVAALHRVVG